ncbi:zinc-binding dehydrogenase [Salibacterium halotolerans]|uniref:Zinc-binding dehydrogenase n=1 Tax=Salibacterium halotolerans TaxID=1884432 RepID=A0A1I5YB84_9BACI|nr:zinc-binding dehydrogenase [Salibacterium halotolerans]SFQ41482.1 Zinc-binding dehydrogenase [Salibacterium halotolerans]
MNAGGSSIARIFTQLSKILGFKIILVIRNEIHREELLNLGAWKVINSALSNVHENIMSFTGCIGATVSIDSVGGESGELLVKCLRQSGKYLSLGLLSGIQVNWKKVNEEYGIKTLLFSLRLWNRSISVTDWHKKFNEIIDLTTNNKLKLSTINKKYSFTYYKKAIHHAQLPALKGKILLTHTN